MTPAASVDNSPSVTTAIPSSPTICSDSAENTLAQHGVGTQIWYDESSNGTSVRGSQRDQLSNMACSRWRGPQVWDSSSVRSATKRLSKRHLIAANLSNILSRTRLGNSCPSLRFLCLLLLLLGLFALPFFFAGIVCVWVSVYLGF